MKVMHRLFSDLYGRLTKRKNAYPSYTPIDVVNAPYSGHATVLSISLQNIDVLADSMQPYELVQFLSKETNRLVKLIEQCHGVLACQIGGQVLAYWKNPVSTSSSIQTELALAAALSMLKTYAPSINVRLVLASENISVNFFGPQRQCQIRGAAIVLAEQLMAVPKENFVNQSHLLLLSAQTVTLLNMDEPRMRLIRHYQDGKDFFELVEDTADC
ncbi:hypothetical protein ACO0LF_19050 [Undibacterium sp. Di27W]|uniref:hypothetical protein n=1 Tax=Undibacterium sp. Di27W TaxID=3413036 RepID=UPI003BF2F3BE